MIKPTVVDFLRHGEVEGGGYFRGITDDPLTESGWRQMHRQCADQRWDAVISSPLLRCQAFATAWGQQQGLNVRTDELWREIDFGDWEGLTAEQINRQSADVLMRYYDDPLAVTPPNAESYRDFLERLHQAWDSLLTDYAGQKVLVITHAGVIRALFSLLLGVSPRQSFQLDVPHACLTRFSCFQDAGSRFAQLNFHKPL